MNNIQKIIRKVSGLMSVVHSLEALERRVLKLESTLWFVSADKWNHWLWVNRTERMDATIDLGIFDEKRRNFHLERYIFATAYAKNKRVLDCACGTGYGTAILAHSGAFSVVGIDIDREAIDYAEKKHSLGNAGRYDCASGLETGLKDCSIDMIVSFETIEHIDDENGLLCEFHRVLVPGGLLIVSTPNRWPLSIAPYHVREYSKDSFIIALQSKFAILEMYNQNSGSNWEFNHDQEAGITPTSQNNESLAECFIAVCQKK